MVGISVGIFSGIFIDRDKIPHYHLPEANLLRIDGYTGDDRIEILEEIVEVLETVK